MRRKRVKKPKEKKISKYANVPHQVYRHYDKDGALLYIGACLNIFHRLSQHHSSSKWFSEITKIDIEHFPTREIAYNAEKNAIISENPRHNKYPIPKRLDSYYIEFLETGVMPERIRDPQDY